MLLANGLQTMTVWIDHERRVVGRAIVWPQAGCAVVHAAVPEGGGMEAIDGLPALRGESQMKASAGRPGALGLVDQQQLVLIGSREPISDGPRPGEHARITERRQGGVIKGRRPRQIGD